MNAQITSIKHKDVTGKELLYLKIEVANKPDVLINVGEKTYNKIQNLFTLTETPEIIGALTPEGQQLSKDALTNMKQKGGKK